MESKGKRVSISKKNVGAAFGFLSILVLVGAGSYWADRVMQGGWKGEEQVRFTKPKRGELNVLLRETASLKPRKVVEIKSKVSGRILGLPYEAGSVIRAGSVIAEIARDDYERALEVGAEELARARRALRSLMPFGEIVTEPERIRVREIGTLVDIVLIDYGAAKVKYLNMREMYERNLISLKTLDEAEKAYDTAYVSYHQSVNAASAVLTSARVQYERALENLQETTIRSPVSGVLTKVRVQEGELVQEMSTNSIGTPIAEVADLSQIVAVAKLSAVDVGGVTPGDPATLTVEARPPVTLRGRVESIAPTGTVGADGVTFDVKIALLETNSTVKPEMRASADILVARSSSALKIPLEAIETGRGGQRVRILKRKPGVAPPELPGEPDSTRAGEEDIYLTGIAPKDRFVVEEREIQIGLSNEIWAEVVGGLDEDAVLKLPDPTPPGREPLRLF